MLVYGVDFGTTNSAIAVYDSGRVTSVPVTSKGDPTMRSVLFFPEKSRFAFIGQEGVERYVASGMKGRLVQSFKTILPDRSFNGSYLNYDWYEIDDLVALILRDLKAKADNLVGREVTSAVLGRPVSFSDSRSDDDLAVQRLITAAHKAGFENVHLQLEPIAAALTYEKSLAKTELVLVADFGGGTSDFTVMRLDPKRVGAPDRKSDILATHGVYIGGDKFDSRIMFSKLSHYFGAGSRWKSWDQWLDVPIHFYHTISEWQKITFLKTKEDRDFIRRLTQTSDNPEAFSRLRALIEENLGFSLFQAIENAKCSLSSRTETEFRFHRSVINIREEFTRSGFERIISSEIEKIGKCVDEVVSQAEISANDISSVFLTGGTSFVPCIQQMLLDRFGAVKLIQGDAFTSVVTGLALSAPLFFSQTNQ